MFCYVVISRGREREAESGDHGSVVRNDFYFYFEYSQGAVLLMG